jgi:cyclopropane fatty-acyl-phospholipid synthase-like methyltransferase
MSNQENWYKNFFHGIALDLWTQAVSEEYTTAEVKFITETAALKNDATILDVPCGFGRHSLALAKQGFSVTGIDIAPAYVQLINERKKQLGLALTIIEADILAYDLSGQFDLAICMGNSFGYFPHEGMLTFCKKVGGALKPGGKFIINTGILAESILTNIKESWWMEVGDILFLMQNTYHTQQSVLQTNMKFVRDGKVETRTSFHYTFTRNEVERMLQAAGFTKIQVFGGLDKSAYKYKDAQAYIVAEK